MRDGYTRRVCPSCGAEGTVERMTCDHCGTVTVPRFTRAATRDEQDGKSS
jgi:predicted RNA-binding Zn-ribbon protein involved in translation (DUF1610 family)